VPLDVVQLEGRAAAGRLIPLDRLLPDLPAVQLSERGAGRARHGNALGPEDLAGPVPVSDSSRPIRLLAPGNRLLGLAEPGVGGLLHPVVVLV
jgi:hypothetical protein